MILWLSTRSTRHACKPRASGDDPTVGSLRRVAVPVNPARAGMIPVAQMAKAFECGKPRASGDDPIKPALTSFMGT